MAIDRYTTLGRSGLAVSPFCLGAMTFGTSWGWGADEAESKAMVYRFVDWGGNFIDTANVYTDGESEIFLGRLLSDPGLRARVVLATKYTFTTDPQGNPNGGGNGRKNACASLDASLARLGADYIDLYWMHCWDRITPVEEVVETFDAFVRAGKIRYYGLSDVPAWYATRAYCYAEQKGLARPIALQHEYSLVERNIEREHIPLAQQLGLGVTPWSPMGGGFLSGKYKNGATPDRNNRLVKTGAGDRFREERAWAILDMLTSVAEEMGRTPAAVALNWVQSAPGITSTIIGARSMAQLESNLEALTFAIPSELRARLDAASELPPIHPYKMFRMGSVITGGSPVGAWQPADLSGVSGPKHSVPQIELETRGE